MSGLMQGLDVLSPSEERPRREFLTCRLGGETYGIDILKVQEIRELERVTRVPQVASFVRGVINLRGAIVPVVDLGLMFGLPQPLPLEGASAIVLNVQRRLVGLVVESVSDVVALTDDEIRDPPDLGDRPVARALQGIGMRADGSAGQDGLEGSILLLDVDHLLGRVREDL
jgi:purine-binding chemotaxis protein CheW